MAVSLERKSNRYRGLSTDAKPGVDREEVGAPVQRPPVGSVFTETDTGDRFVWTSSGEWARQEQTIEDLFERLIEVNVQILAKLSDTHRGHEEYLWNEPVEPE